jgi:hypothetical protein
VHEIRLSVPPDRVEDAVGAAHRTGIERITVLPTTIHRPKGVVPAVMISAETSTPRARAFADAVLTSRWFDRATCTMTTRELRAIVSDEPLDPLTYPMPEPSDDVLQDLWQLSHVTPSYLGRCVAGALLLVRGMLADDLVALLLAVLFLPFLSELRGLAYGAMRGDRSLVRHALKAIATTVVTLVIMGGVAGIAVSSPVQYDGLKGPLISFAIAFVIGTAAGLASADDAGRRYMIGVAAAAQLSVFPAYFGIALVRGFPPSLGLVAPATSFAISFITVVVTIAASYAAVAHRHSKRGTV